MWPGVKFSPVPLSVSWHSSKTERIELRNFQNPFLHQFCTCWPKENFTPAIGRLWRTSEWRHVLPFRSKIRVFGNCCHTLIARDKDNRKRLLYSEKNGLRKCYLEFLKLWKCWKCWDFFNIFYFYKNPAKFQIKNGIYVIEPLKNVCSKFQVISFRNVLL